MNCQQCRSSRILKNGIQYCLCSMSIDDQFKSFYGDYDDNNNFSVVFKILEEKISKKAMKRPKL